MAYKPKAGSILSTPNVIPMADIMLVLLIIMMVVTPMLQKGVTVDMARARNWENMPNADKDNAIVVAITRDGHMFLGNEEVQLDQISSLVKSRLANRLDKTVFVRSDARAHYGSVVKVVDEVRSAGVDNLGLLTQKLETNQPNAPPPPPPGTGENPGTP